MKDFDPPDHGKFKDQCKQQIKIMIDDIAACYVNLELQICWILDGKGRCCI